MLIRLIDRQLESHLSDNTTFNNVKLEQTLLLVDNYTPRVLLFKKCNQFSHVQLLLYDLIDCIE